MKVRKALGPEWRILGLSGLLLGASLSAMEPATATEPSSGARPTTTENKVPEIWTLEERLEARFDPENQKQRLERAHAERASLGGQPDPNAPKPIARDVIHISGALEPELYVPSELFTILIRSGFHVDTDRRSRFRTRVMNRAQSLGFDESLWTALEEVSRELIQHSQEASRYLEKVNRRLSEASPAEIEAVMEEVGRKDIEAAVEFELCRKGFEALSAARLRFESDRFDLLLYRAVAPQLQTASSATAEEIRFVEGGCQ